MRCPACLEGGGGVEMSRLSRGGTVRCPVCLDGGR